MKLEVGMYVRYKKFSYSKEIKIGKLTNVQFQEVDNCSGRQIILKASHNIIDLIEVGDYVNGYLIDYIDSERRFLRSERPYRENSSWYKDLIENGKDYNMCLHFKEEDIKSIVTKEQFESMSYKVE